MTPSETIATQMTDNLSRNLYKDTWRARDVFALVVLWLLR